MRREIIAVILLLIMLSGSLFNIRYSEMLIFTLEDEATSAAQSAASGDFDKAKSQLKAASQHWLELDGYTHIFIRHSEIDAVTDAFFDFETALSEEDSDAYEGAYGLLMAHLESIRTMEKLRFGSIF